jgi:hypothetical protein
LEPTIPASEQPKTVHALDRSATVTDIFLHNIPLRFIKIAGSIPDEVIGFFNLPNPFSRNLALGSTQPLREMSTRYLPGGKWGPARKADNLTAICEPIV